MEDTFHLGIKALIRNTAGQVLLLQVNRQQLSGERRDYWDLPGGRIQRGDTIEATLHRELEEEIGVVPADDPKPLGTVLSNIRIPVDDGTVGLMLSVYTCMLPADAKIVLSDEHTAYEWVAPTVAAERLGVKYPADFCQIITDLV